MDVPTDPTPEMQFSIRRMLGAVTIVAIISALFGSLPWPVAMLVLAGVNWSVAVACWFTGQHTIGKFAAATCALIISALVFTDWGFSSPSARSRIAWNSVVAAGMTQLLAIGAWLVEPSPRLEDEQDGQNRRIAD